MEGLLPEPVSPNKKCFCLAIPESEGEHSVEAFEAACSSLFVEMDDDLSVGVGSKPVAFFFEFFSEIPKVVNLTVEHYPDGVILVCHRLSARRREIDDAESFMSEADGYFRRILDQLSFIVGTSVPQDTAHPLQRLWIDGTLQRNVSVDAAHQDALSE